MKVSLAWIFDHIDADWKSVDIDELVTKFNQITAEIEHVHRIDLDLCPFAMGKVERCSDSEAGLLIPEWNTSLTLPARFGVKVGAVFMLKKNGSTVSYAEDSDLGLEKPGYLPAFDIENEDLDGSWKNRVENEDVLLEVDNKSITHRPDMWGHRGFAREIAAILNLHFISKDHFLKNKEVIYSEKQAKQTATNPFTIENQAPDACNRFSGLYFPSIENKASDVHIAARLARVGTRPISAIVDLTNYLLQDWSQPVHAFDAGKVDEKKIIVRFAKPGEKLCLLDDQEIELSDQDLVVADGEKPLSLAGIMGGKNDSITPQTTGVFLESAHFEPAAIRRSAQRHKIRTESSARFEKMLDPNQLIEGVQRFLWLADRYGVTYVAADEILCVGLPVPNRVIEVSHAYLQKRTGFDLEQSEIVGPLEKIGFGVNESDGVYTIVIPSFRGAKDVQLKEDILEEVVRFYGFNRIKAVLPAFAKGPTDLTPLMRRRLIKNLLSGGKHMTELHSYALYDESFIAQLGYDPGERGVEVENPISEHYTRMVTSLVPHLLKAIDDNVLYDDRLRFFELARRWDLKDDKIIEERSLAGVIFNKRGPVDFYDGKKLVSDLLHALDFTKVTWQQVEPQQPWYARYRTAEIRVDGKLLGRAGMVDGLMLKKLDVLPESEAFIFELDADLLIDYAPPVKTYHPISRYQQNTFDLSFMVPSALTVSEIESMLSSCHDLVRSVRLIDHFEKDEWAGKRALAFSVDVGSDEKTLEKEEIEAARTAAIAIVENAGATLRA